MHLPSFLWLWKIAAWSMGWTLGIYLGLLGMGWWLRQRRLDRRVSPRWLRMLHVVAGFVMLFLVLLLLAIGIVGTLGHFGSLGHSWHLPMGLLVVALSLGAAWSGTRIRYDNVQTRSLHIRINGLLGMGLILVLISGWAVVQKYIP